MDVALTTARRSSGGQEARGNTKEGSAASLAWAALQDAAGAGPRRATGDQLDKSSVRAGRGCWARLRVAGALRMPTGGRAVGVSRAHLRGLGGISYLLLCCSWARGDEERFVTASDNVRGPFCF